VITWLATLFDRALNKLRRRYDPARHYMRGPGPACAAKTQRVRADVE
jgi:hypothetical protein